MAPAQLSLRKYAHRESRMRMFTLRPGRGRAVPTICLTLLLALGGVDADQSGQSRAWDCTGDAAETSAAPRWNCLPGEPTSGHSPAAMAQPGSQTRIAEPAPAVEVTREVRNATPGVTASSQTASEPAVPAPSTGATAPPIRLSQTPSAGVVPAQAVRPAAHWELSEPAASAAPAAGSSAAPTGEPVDEGYRVQPGDILQISVWGEDELNREVLVRPDGNISYPLVGEVLARGQTVAWIDSEISRRLDPFIPAAEVSVAVRQVVGNSVFVVGKVNRPGQIVATRQLDVMQALGIAGGLTRFADGDEIKVVRRVDGQQKAFPFRYGDIEQGKNLELNILLQPGDLVVVP